MAFVAVGMIVLRFGRYRWRMRVLDDQRQLLNDATKAQLEELKEPPI